MIDTIKAYLILDPKKNPIPILHFQSCLENPKITEGSMSGGYLNGYLKNIKISVQYDTDSGYAHRLSIYGSVPKFLYGNNIASCNPSDIQTFIDTLYSALDIDVSSSIVTRIDFGINFSVTSPVPEYLASIVGYPRLMKSGFTDESVTFHTKSNSWAVSFYDKIREIRDKNKPHEFSNIPKEFYDLNILRFEVRYKMQPHKRLGVAKQICLSDLVRKRINKIMYQKLETVLSNTIIQELKYPTSNLVGQSDFLKKYLSLIGLKEYGMDNILKVIKDSDFGVKNPSVKRSTLKKQLRELASLSDELHGSGVRSALEAKINALKSIFYLNNYQF